MYFPFNKNCLLIPSLKNHHGNWRCWVSPHYGCSCVTLSWAGLWRAEPEWGLRGLGASADLRAGAASVTEVWIFRNKDLSLKADTDSNSLLTVKVKCKWIRIVTFHSPLSPFVKNFKSVRAKPFFQTLNRQYVFFIRYGHFTLTMQWKQISAHKKVLQLGRKNSNILLTFNLDVKCFE